MRKRLLPLAIMLGKGGRGERLFRRSLFFGCRRKMSWDLAEQARYCHIFMWRAINGR